MNGARVVSIDGAAGSGKSTLGRVLARRMGLPYVNTGLMYRALAAAALAAGVSPDDADGLTALCGGLRYRLTEGNPPELEVEGWDSDSLTTADVERTVSAVAAHPQVRASMREAQRRLGESGAVMEGRDIASVVFPDAALKLYLHAGAGERAARRVAEREGSGEAVAADLRDRDRRDARTNPHVPSPDAVVIDTGVLDADETLAAALDAVRSRAPELLP
ncbi:MAG TPA: (d)CMP kinase [Actinomycetota bacterium]